MNLSRKLKSFYDSFRFSVRSLFPDFLAFVIGFRGGGIKKNFSRNAVSSLKNSDIF